MFWTENPHFSSQHPPQCAMRKYAVSYSWENCSMTREYSSKRSVCLRFNLYFCHVYRRILLFSFCSTKISENSDMAKSWAARFCRLASLRNRLCCLASLSNRLCRLPKQELLLLRYLKSLIFNSVAELRAIWNSSKSFWSSLHSNIRAIKTS